MRTFAATMLSTLLAAAAAQANEEPLTPYQWQQAQKVAFEQSERIYADALKRNGLLAQYAAMRDAYRADKNKAFRIVFGQYLSWYQSFVGDYAGAHDSYSIRQLPAPDDGPSPLGGRYQAKPALDAIAELAKGRRAVFFNEAHNVPLTRTLTVQLLSRLREQGYDYFAAETIYSSDKDLQKRGYPNAQTGFYTMEPICAEMVRTALALGFKVVAYESEREGNGDIREHDQAKHLYERVFRDSPDARVVVNAGYAHIQENGKYLGGRSMAQHFARISGIDPLTVEQTMMIEHPPGTESHPYYLAAVAQLRPTAPIVFVDAKGEPWTLKPKAYDVSVVFPPTPQSEERPAWADLGGLRKPYFVAGDICQKQFPCLVEARYVAEGDDAIPADRLVLDPINAINRVNEKVIQGAVEVHGYLYLRPGRYRLSSVDRDNRPITRKEITIEGATPRAKAATVQGPCAVSTTSLQGAADCSRGA